MEKSVHRALLFLFLAVTSPAALGQGLAIGVEDAIVVPSTGGYAEAYARSVDLSGDVIAAGAPYVDDLAGNAGAIYVHRRVGGTWIEEARLFAWNGAAGDELGRAVALDGDTIVACTSKPGGGTGKVYVFVRSGGIWQPQQELAPGDGVLQAGFGFSVALEGDRAVIAAPFDNTLAEQAGSVYVFDRSGTVWSETAKLYASDPTPYDFFGWAVELDGETLAVTATGANGAVPSAGAAYVFDHTGGTWSEQQKVFAPDGQTSEYWGQSVGLDGDTLIVGTTSHSLLGNAAGAAYAFTRTAGTWSLAEKLFAPDWAEGDQYGVSIALQGNVLVVGAHTDEDIGMYGGSAYLYHRQGAAWTLVAKLLPSDEVTGFSASSAIDGSTFVLTAPTGGSWGSLRIYSDPPRVPGLPRVPGDGSASPCPCGNESQPGLGVGCASSTGIGARVHAFGSTSVASDDLGAWVSRLPASQFCLLWGGTTLVGGGSGTAFGDGLRAAGGGVVRLGIRLAGSTGAARWSGGLATSAGWSAGQVVYLQGWYRDPVGGPCGFEFNTTNGLEVQLTP